MKKDAVELSGSSPLARGTPPAVPEGELGERFIPARAGNTVVDDGRGVLGPVHPRSRGEHGGSLDDPMGRGRFIPARAGNTSPSPTHCRALPVHPRSRGEHLPPYSPELKPHGSSPLARGTQRSPVTGASRTRFIPARAGNTSASPSAPSPTTVHPRSRGEHTTAVRVPLAEAGSSPLARGTLGGACHSHLLLRFIPARAGNTESTSS